MSPKTCFRFVWTVPLSTLLTVGLPAWDNATIHFTDVTPACGLDFIMTSGQSPSQHILEVDGGGVALFDFDGDGDLDAFFANGASLTNPELGPGSRLYANDGEGTFADVTDAYEIDVKRWAMGAAVGDYDDDGRDDLYVTCYGPNVLLRNNAQASGGSFLDTTAPAGVGNEGWGTSAAFGDIDRDGDLDLYVVNYLVFDHREPPSRAGVRYKGVSVMAGPHGLTPQADVLYLNLGNGRFSDITREAGCHRVEPGYGLVGRIMDFDHDGRQDIFVGNDSTENFLFRNVGDRQFEPAGDISGIASNMDGNNQATMGISVADVDGNGRADVFTTSFSSDSNTLHLGFDGGFFEDRTGQFGLGFVSRPFLCWGCGFYDFDLDGDEDLFVSAGHVYPEAATHAIDSKYEQPQLLFQRSGSRFARHTEAGDLVTEPRRGRAAAFGDLDDDGDVDIVLTQLNGSVRVHRNDARGGHALAVTLRQKGKNHRGYGSVIELRSRTLRQTRWIHGGGSYQSVDAPMAYFGLSDPPPDDLSLVITWPDGDSFTWKPVLLNRFVTVIRGTESPVVREFRRKR